jgi:hypothetical protein
MHRETGHILLVASAIAADRALVKAHFKGSLQQTRPLMTTSVTCFVSYVITLPVTKQPAGPSNA